MTVATSLPIPAARGATLPFAACVALVLCSTILQKLAVPGFAGALALSFVALVSIAGILLTHDSLRVSASTLIAFCVFVAVSAVTISTSASDQLSLFSWALFCIVQASLMLRFAHSSLDYGRLLGFISSLGVVLAIGGVLQLVVQSLIGAHLAFWLDYNLPKSIELVGYNKLNQMAWDVQVYKSNGIFFSEPSCFSQFLAIAMLSEFLHKGRLARMLIIAAGLISSYSGTGLMTLAAFSLAYIPPSSRWQLAFAAVGGAIVLIVAGDALNLSVITSRISEFTTPDTSGHARFVSIFSLIDRAIFTDPVTVLFGRGPGTVTEFFNSQPFETFAPTYGKLFYEYGVLGSLAYAAYFYFAILKDRMPLALPLAFTYVFLGGYLVDAAMIAQIAVLAAWPSRSRSPA